jgi:hypothetical protein
MYYLRDFLSEHFYEADIISGLFMAGRGGGYDFIVTEVDRGIF